MELGKRAAVQLKMKMGRVKEATGKLAGKHGVWVSWGVVNSLVWQDYRSSWKSERRGR